jgi:Uma2 family endonuclease
LAESNLPDSRLASPGIPHSLRFVMETAVKVWTDEELMTLPKDGHKRELLHGEIITSPAGYRHERIVAILLSAMFLHATKHRLGVVCGSGLGCWMTSGNLLSPDVSFIAKSRLPGAAVEREKYLRGAPDLVVEIQSPWDRSVRLQEKTADYFASGARLVWVIDPAERTALICRTPEADRLLRVTEALDGEDVLPGFRLPLAELFAELSFE